MHGTFMLLYTTKFGREMGPLEKFALLCGALGHDVDHRGKTNDFERLTRSPLALLYNDKSILENHHTSMTFLAMEEEGANITANFTTKERQDFRAIVVDGILHTDMQHHSATCNKFSELSTQPEVARDTLSADAVATLKTSCIHVADLAGMALSPEIAADWSTCVVKEFAAEAQALEELGLDVPGYMQNQDKPATVAKGQLFFIEHVLMPMWLPLSKILPEIDDRVQNLHKNIDANRRLAAQ